MTNKFTVTTDDTQALTNKDLTGSGNTFPTFNQSTTGNAATATKLATARKINGVSFDGTADINSVQGFAPADYGFIAWSYDPATAYANNIITAGQANLMLIPVRAATTITNVITHVAVAGATLTSGQCFAGLFNSSGTLLSATADQSTAWQSVGLKTMALTSAQSVAAGLYYVGIFGNGTTLPQFYYNGAAKAGVGASTTIGSTPRMVIDTTNTGLTTAFHSPATLTSANAPYYWAAVS